MVKLIDLLQWQGHASLEAFCTCLSNEFSFSEKKREKEYNEKLWKEYDETKNDVKRKLTSMIFFRDLEALHLINLCRFGMELRGQSDIYIT